MSNELLWVIFLVVDLFFALLIFKVFGKKGLYALIAANIIMCNIQVAKTIQLFGFIVTLGNVLYGSIFLATDLLSEFYGKKEAQKGVLVGFVFMIFMTIVMQMALMFTPSSDGIVVHKALTTIFSIMPRIAFASLVAYMLSQLHDVWAYHFIKKKTAGKMLWLRNNLSTMVSQLIDSLIFCLIAFWGMEQSILIEIIISTYVMKVLVAIADTPFIYMAKKMVKVKR